MTPRPHHRSVIELDPGVGQLGLAIQRLMLARNGITAPTASAPALVGPRAAAGGLLVLAAVGAISWGVGTETKPSANPANEQSTPAPPIENPRADSGIDGESPRTASRARTSTPLHVAARDGDLAALEVAGESASFDVNAVDGYGNAYIYYAASEGRLSTVRFLLDRGATFEMGLIHQRTTPLHRAGSRGHPAVVSLLLERGADVDALDVQQRTALMRSMAKPSTKHLVLRADRIAIAKLLLAHGANVDVVGYRHRTALHRAVKYGYLDSTRMLLDANASLEVASEDGATPLHETAQYNRADAAALLLAYGADPRATTNEGLTPEAVARAFENHGLAERFAAASRDFAPRR